MKPRCARALELAARGLYSTQPNPRVGAVLARDEEIVGEGWHERAGEPHAEPIAVRAAGDRARGATAYVTLEPCCHHGRTPPCVDVLLAAGVRRVVYAVARSESARERRRRQTTEGSGRHRAVRPAGRGRGGVECGIHDAHAPRTPVHPPQDRRESRRPHRARERREPLDHERGGARRRAALARAERRGAHERRYRARGRSAARRAHRRAASAAARRARPPPATAQDLEDLRSRPARC